MVLSNDEINKLHNGLKYNFLYKSDEDSIHLLLNLLDLEYNITKIYPTYICSKHIHKRLIKLLDYRQDKHLIVENISNLLLDDINRLELAFYLEGYRNGFYDKKWVNTLENTTIKCLPINELYERLYLFHYQSRNRYVKNIKNQVFSDINSRESKSQKLSSSIDKYCDKMIRLKVYNLNKFVDKQLSIEYLDDEIAKVEEMDLLSIKEIDLIYKTIKNTLINWVIRIHKEAYWFGINDRVLCRY